MPKTILLLAVVALFTAALLATPVADELHRLNNLETRWQGPPILVGFPEYEKGSDDDEAGDEWNDEWNDEGDDEGDDDDEADDEGSDEGDDCPPYPAPVPKTGQTIPHGFLGAGDDGLYQYGVAVDPRFTDNGDGTVVDNLTGLIWLKNAWCFGSDLWHGALHRADDLADGTCGLTDGSTAGDWRLPNIRELSSLVDYGHSWPALPPEHPFTNVQLWPYWSSTTFDVSARSKLYVNLRHGTIGYADQDGFLRVWPVRGGQ